MESKKHGVALVIEGGGAKGAFSTQLLCQLDLMLDKDTWFKAVTGSSIGGVSALIAGIREIESLKEMWQHGLCSKKIYFFNLATMLQKDPSLFSNEPMRQTLNNYLSDKIVKKVKETSVEIILTALRWEDNRIVQFENDFLKDKKNILFALLATTAIPAVFKPVRDKDGNHLVDTCQRYPLPIKSVLEKGYKKFILITHEPLDLDLNCLGLKNKKWKNIPHKEESAKTERLDHVINRIGDLTTRNLAWKDIEKLLLLQRIDPEIEIVILSPTEELDGILDFSRKSLDKSMHIADKVFQKNKKQIEEIFSSRKKIFKIF